MKKNSKGFTVIEIMFFVLVAMLIVGAIFYAGTRVGEKDDKDASTTQTQAKQSDPSDIDTWQTFEDNETNTSFKYPSDWKVDIKTITEQLGDEPAIKIAEGTVTSPSGRVALNYSNLVDGLGGVGCPEAIPCPTVNILKIEDIPGSKSTLKYIEKITHWKDSGDYRPVIGLLNATAASKIKVGSMEDNDLYMLIDFGRDRTGYFVLGAFGGGQESPSFATYEEAEAYLDSANANIAKEILKSFTIK